VKGFGDHHLGERAAALVDGELGTDARDLALAHVARCDLCRADVAAQRRLKARLGGLAQPPQPPGLAARLAALAEQAFDQPPGSAAGAGSLPAAKGSPSPSHAGRGRRVVRPPRRADLARPVGRVRARRRMRMVMAGGASLVALGVTAFAAGGSSAPTVVPDVQQFTAQYASTTGTVPFEVPLPTVASGYFRQVSAP
jgi:hypothetical protein